MRASGVMPSSSALVSLITMHRGGAVVERAGVAGGDLPSGRNTGFSAASFSTVVPARGPSSFDTTVPSGSVTGVISARRSRSLTLATARCCDARRTRPSPRGVTPLELDDVLGGLAHGDVDVGQPGRRRPRRLAAARRARLVRALGVARTSGCAAPVSAAPCTEAADGLDAGGDEHVALAGLDRVGGHADRLQRRRAVAVDGDAGDVAQPGEDGDDAGDVEARLAGGLAAAQDQVLDERADRAAGTLSSSAVDDQRRQVVGAARRRASPCWPGRSGVRAVATMTASGMASIVPTGNNALGTGARRAQPSSPARKWRRHNSS